MAIRRPPDLPQDSGNIASKKRARLRTPSMRQLSAATSPDSAVSEDIRRTMIAEAAYLRSEQRGFTRGYELEDWLLAEREVDALLSAKRGSVPQ